MSSILRITDPIPSDDSIDKYEHFEYGPITGTNLNNSRGNIRIDMKLKMFSRIPTKAFYL